MVVMMISKLHEAVLLQEGQAKPTFTATFGMQCVLQSITEFEVQ
jgi:hypothetical protein